MYWLSVQVLKVKIYFRCIDSLCRVFKGSRVSSMYGMVVLKIVGVSSDVLTLCTALEYSEVFLCIYFVYRSLM